jgi:hypothetical protein
MHEVVPVSCAKVCMGADSARNPLSLNGLSDSQLQIGDGLA